MYLLIYLFTLLLVVWNFTILLYNIYFFLFPIFKAWELWTSDRGSDLVDPLLDDVSSIHVALKCVNIGLFCVQENAADRPTMSDVVAMLSNESTALPYPKQPAFSIMRSVMKENQGSQFRTILASTAGIYCIGQCTSTDNPLVSYQKKYRFYWRNPTVSVSKWIPSQNTKSLICKERKQRRRRKGRIRRSRGGTGKQLLLLLLLLLLSFFSSSSLSIYPSSSLFFF